MTATELRVAGRPPRGVRGKPALPRDKSISHRALLLSVLADGTSNIVDLAAGDDVGRTLAAVWAMGAEIRQVGPGGFQIAGGRSTLRVPTEPVDCGNSGTSMRLLAGFCAGFSWTVELVGDRSLSRRPMDRVAHPLVEMGASVSGDGSACRPPLRVEGGRLHGIDYDMPVASAQVKSAVLLAGLSADGETVVREHVRTRAHTEELLERAGADIDVTDDGLTTRLRASALKPLDVRVPADPSQGAFWAVAACIVPRSEVLLEGVYWGQARVGFVRVLQEMGADVVRELAGDHTADLRFGTSALQATEVGGDLIPALIDEIPVLAVAATQAEGTTVFRDATELRVKESDRIATMATELSKLGADVEPMPDGLVVRGPTKLRGTAVSSHGDHRVAMALAVAALAAEGETVIGGWEAVSTSYPTFEDDLRRCVS